MASFNSVTLIGNLTRDVEVRQAGSTSVADVSLAVNKKWTNKAGDKQESVAFIDCTLWGKTAEIAGQYLSKGSSVLFQGELVQDTWEDKESGQKRSKLKVKVDTMQFLGGNPGGGGGDKPAQQSRGKSQQAASDYAQYDATPDETQTPF